MAGSEGGGVMNWTIGIGIYTLIRIKWITNKNLLYKKIYNKIKKKKNQHTAISASKTKEPKGSKLKQSGIYFFIF